MNRAIASVFCALWLAVYAGAQEKPAEARQAAAETPLPGVDEVLDRYVAALGGKAAFERFNSRVVKGSFEIPAMGVVTTAEIHAKAPNKWLLTIDIPGFGLVQQCYDGTSGWAQDPQMGLRDLSGGELEALKRGAEFNQALKLKELYRGLEVKAKTKIGEREAFILEAANAEGSPEKMYFDTETNLLVRADVEVEGPMGKTPFEISFEDYKDVEGVKIAHTVRRSSQAISFIIKVEEVRHNVDIEDEKFRKPVPEKPATEEKPAAPEKPAAEEKKTP